MSERNHFTLGWHVGVCAPTLCALLIACSGNVTTDPPPNGEDLPSTGGGSDGNFTAALGVPTLDGLGAVGEGAHASHESILAEHLVPRTALLAALIASL